MKQDILQALRNTLKYHQGIGIPGYRHDGVIAEFLSKERKPALAPELPKKTLVLRNASSTSIENKGGMTLLAT